MITLAATGSAGLRRVSLQRSRSARAEHDRQQREHARRCTANACHALASHACRRRPYQSRNIDDEQRDAAGGGDQLAGAQALAHARPPACARLERVAQQHRDRHRPDAAGHGRDQPRRARRAASNSTSPTRPSSVRLMPTSITTAPSLTQSPWTSRGRADGGDQHVGAAADLGEVARARVADRSRWRWRPAAARRPACRRGPSGRRRPPRRPRARRRGGAAAPCTPDGVHGPQARAGPWPAGRRRSA